MKALAIRQPYAWLIVNGYKKKEYRSWLTHYRGRFFVHANKDIDKEKVEQIRLQKAREDIIIPDDLPLGGIVGIVTLVDCVPYNDVSRPQRLLGRLRGQHSPCGDQHEGICYSFILRDARPLPFKPLRGRQKFFNVADDLYGPEFEI